MAGTINRTEKALQMLRILPRVTLGNLQSNPGSKPNVNLLFKNLQTSSLYSIDLNFSLKGVELNMVATNMVLATKGLDNGKIICAWVMKQATRHSICDFHMNRTIKDTSKHYKNTPHPVLLIINLFRFSLRRSYPPITLLQLQTMIDTNRLNTTLPIDITTLCQTGLFTLKPDFREFGFQLTDEGSDLFKTKLNIEVQHASELVIATIERNGGVITTSYYDAHSLYALRNPLKWFEKGVPIPVRCRFLLSCSSHITNNVCSQERMLPPQDAIEYYTNPKNRGYLADPEAISRERLVLAQKYGYELPEIEKDSDYDMLNERKDPRQIFFGLNPGWVVSVKDQAILKAKNN
jgi:hypothetical protein